jgi:hypothetical protein
MPDPFAVDEDKALSALSLAWGDVYEIRITGGQWQARHKEAGAGDMITGSTPDELNVGVRDDWTRREAPDGQ